MQRIKRKMSYFVGRDASLLRTVRPYTLMPPAKLRNLKRLALSLSGRAVAGDYVECGTYKGGSAAVLATTLTPDRHMWLYDSFQGLPDVRDVDGEAARDAVGKCVASAAEVAEVLDRVGTPQQRYTIREGWFQDSFRLPLPERVALLHCDADWYDSVTIVLDTFYDRVPEGGVVVLDDFGAWEGCREAFYDFCSRTGEKPLLERCEWDQAYWIKGRKHNRDLS